MNIALIIAGGIGARMQQDIPKQFINVNNKPVIIYTLEAFQSHPSIDAISVVCLEGWHDVLRAYAKQFGITKLENIVNGGPNGQDSIRNGIQDVASRHCGKDDIVLIHDAIRPLVSAEIISDNIRVCRQYGNATTVIPCNTAMLKSENDIVSETQLLRNTVKMTQTPQSFFVQDLLAAHEEALAKGITASVASCTMYIELGRKVFLSSGSEKNIKITNSEDIEIFTALLMTRKEAWMH